MTFVFRFLHCHEGSAFPSSRAEETSHVISLMKRYYYFAQPEAKEEKAKAKKGKNRK